MANRMTSEELFRMCKNAANLGMNPQRLLLLDQRLTEWSQTQRTPSIVVRVLRHGALAFEGAYGVSGPGRPGDSLSTDAIFRSARSPSR